MFVGQDGASFSVLTIWSDKFFQKCLSKMSLEQMTFWATVDQLTDDTEIFASPARVRHALVTSSKHCFCDSVGPLHKSCVLHNV